jgi:hypothetical protein
LTVPTTDVKKAQVTIAAAHLRVAQVQLRALEKSFGKDRAETGAALESTLLSLHRADEALRSIVPDFASTPTDTATSSVTGTI